MRQILNISLPASMLKIVKKEVKEGGFASVSEFIRHLIRLHNTEKLFREVQEARSEYNEGKAKKIRSLRDLVE